MAIKWALVLVLLALWIGLSAGIRLGRHLQLVAGLEAAKKLLAMRKAGQLAPTPESQHSLQQPDELIRIGRELIERRK